MPTKKWNSEDNLIKHIVCIGLMTINNGNIQFHQTNTKHKQWKRPISSNKHKAKIVHHSTPKENNIPSLSYTPLHTQITPNPKIFQRTHHWIKSFHPALHCFGMIGSGTQCLLELHIMDTHIPLFSPPHNLGLEPLLKCNNYIAYSSRGRKWTNVCLIYVYGT